MFSLQGSENSGVLEVSLKLAKSDVYLASFGLESRRSAGVFDRSLEASSMSSNTGVMGTALTGVCGLLPCNFRQLDCRSRSAESSEIVGLSLSVLSGVRDFGGFFGGLL